MKKQRSTLLGNMTWLRRSLAALSGITSGIGLWVIFSNGNDPWLAGGTAFLFAVMLQVLILKLWDVTFVDLGVGPRTAALLGAAFFALVSGLLASGSYTVLFNKAAYEEFETDREVAGVEIPLVAQQRSLEQISGELEQLAHVAEARANVENTTGGSCVGTPSQVGAGPRWRLRMSHAEEARKHASSLRGVSDDLSLVVASMRGAKSEADLLGGYNKAQRLSNDGRLVAVEAWASGLVAGFAAGFEDTGNGVLSCSDPEMATAAEQLIVALGGAPELPARPPRMAEFTHVDALMKSYGDAFAIAGSTVGLVSLGDVDRSSIAYSYVGFIAGFIVELGIFALTWIHEALRFRAGESVGSAEAFRRGAREIDEDDVRTLVNIVHGRGRLDPILNVAMDLIYDVGQRTFLFFPLGRRKFFLVPVDGDTNVRRQARRIAMLFSLHCNDRRHLNWSIAKLNPNFVESRVGILDDVTKVDLYPITKAFERELGRLIRDSAASGPPSDFGPEGGGVEGADTRTGFKVHTGGKS